MKNSTLIVAAIAATLVTGSSRANLIGTTFNFTLNHDDGAGTNITVSPVHTFGTLQTGLIGLDSTVSPFAGFDNHIAIDLSSMSFMYGTPLLAKLNISGLSENANLSTIALLDDGVVPVPVPLVLIPTLNAPNAFQLQWDETALTDPNQSAVLNLVWNSVPTPGPLALLGIAGILAQNRRRRE